MLSFPAGRPSFIYIKQVLIKSQRNIPTIFTITVYRFYNYYYTTTTNNNTIWSDKSGICPREVKLLNLKLYFECNPFTLRWKLKPRRRVIWVFDLY